MYERLVEQVSSLLAALDPDRPPEDIGTAVPARCTLETINGKDTLVISTTRGIPTEGPIYSDDLADVREEVVVAVVAEPLGIHVVAGEPVIYDEP